MSGTAGFAGRFSPATEAGKLNVLLAVVAGVSTVVTISWVFGLWRLLHDPGYGAEAADIDFSVYWAAARLAIEGDWLAPFDPVILNQARMVPQSEDTFTMLWFYPPAYHIAIWPLGHLPFFWAWLVFGAISLVVFATALRPAARGVRGGFVMVLCSPVTLCVLALGQNTLLVAGLLLFALEALRREQPILAGLALALITMKPQLGLAIPIALAAGGYWRTIGWAALLTAIIVAATMLHPGPDYWRAFFNGLVEGSDLLRDGDLESLMISSYGNGVVAYIPQDTSLIVQTCVSVAAAIALGVLWRHPGASFDQKAAGLCFAILLITPYAIYYELVIAIVGGLYLARDGFGKQRWERAFLAFLWIAPVIGLLTLPRPGFVFSAVMLGIALAITLVRAKAVHRAPA